MKKVLNIRVEEGVKKNAEAVFEKLGLSMSAGINIYLAQVAMKRAVPFELSEAQQTRKLSKRARMKLLDSPRHRFHTNADGVMVPDDEIPNSLKDWIQNG
jgi:DNA-damage-inducible protein J